MIYVLTSGKVESGVEIKVDNSLEMFTPPQSEATQSLKEYRRLFGRDDVFMISAKGDVFSVEFLKKLKTLEEEIKLVNRYKMLHAIIANRETTEQTQR